MKLAPHFAAFGLLFWSLSSLLAAPSATVVSPAAGETMAALTSIQVTFSEPVSGVDASDLLINAEAASTLAGTGAGPYVFGFTQPAAGSVTISWDFDHGIAGVEGTGAFDPGTGWSYTLKDTIAPTIGKIRTSVAGQEMDAITPTPGALVFRLPQVEITFSEPVSGVDAADLLISGQPAKTVAGSDASYVFTPPEPFTVPVQFQWATTTGIADAAGNAFAGGAWETPFGTAGNAPRVVISEFMAANATGLKDEDGETSDWIEIENRGPSAVGLLGWSLSNDADQPGIWILPARSLAAGARLVVFASGKDRKPASGALHTNFILNAAGGRLALFGPESPRAVASAFEEYPAQRFDHSYGLQANGSAYFTPPSPDAANGVAGLSAITPAPALSVARGFFNEPFQLIISCADPEASIHYTLDGSAPLAASAAYTQPLAISATTVLRAAAFRAGKVPSDLVTHSYIYLDQVLQQPSPPYNNPDKTDDDTNPALPNVGGVTFPVHWGTRAGFRFPGQIKNLAANIVPADYGMDPDIINDPAKYDNNGVVSEAAGMTNLERIKRGMRELPLLSIVMQNEDMFGPKGLYPNSLTKGVGFEKAISLELLLPDGTTGFSTTCGLRVHGNASREPNKSPKHGFKLNFKGSFGATSLAHGLFPDSPIDEFDDLILRADFNSSWLHWDGATQRPRGTRLRDAFSKATFRDMGRMAGHHRYVHLFINGLYWGVYDPTEQENNGFGAAYFGGKKEQVDVVEQGALKSGTIDVYRAMTTITQPITNAKYEQMKGYLNVPWYMDYMLMHFYLGHTDWGDDINKNWYSVRPKGGKFHYLPWDMENLMFNLADNRTTVASPASGLHPKLFTNAQYKLDFADRVHRHLVAPDGALQPSANIARWNGWRSVLTHAIACESARWGDYRRDVHQFDSGPFPLFTWNQHWIAENNRLTGTYFPARTNTVLGQLRTRGLYPTLNTPEFRNAADDTVLLSRHVPAGFSLKIALPTVATGTTSAGQIYYTTDGSDPRVYFDITGQFTATAKVYNAPLAIAAATVVKARALNGTVWSALMEATLTVGSPLPPIRITEIHYNPPTSQGGTAAEFIELQNTGKIPVDLSAWYFRGIEFVVPMGTMLEPGDRLVLASNNAPTTFAAQYPSLTVAGYFRGALDNAGERLALLDRDGRVITSVDFRDAAPWPKAADGGGSSLELANAEADSHNAASWRASAAKGSPGAANASPATSVVIHEFLTNRDASTLPTHLELHNPGTAAADLSGWIISIRPGVDVTLPNKTAIPAGGFLPVLFGSTMLDSNYPSFKDALPSEAGQIVLLNAAGQAVDGLRYGPQVADLAFGRVNGAWTLTTPTFNAANKAAEIALATSIRLNEWLADPAPGFSDWLELHNPADKPAILTGLHVSNGAQLFRVPVLAAIAAKEFAVFDCGEADDDGNALAFPLPKEGATLALLDGAGAQFDSVAYGPQAAGISQGRQPDGTGSVAGFIYPSPGVANGLGPEANGPFFEEVLVTNATVATAPWGRPASWVEIGVSDTAILRGYSLRTIGTVSLTWKIPADLKAGDTDLFIWCDPLQAASTQAGPLNSGLPLNDLTKVWGLELISDLGVQDRVTWGQQIPDHSLTRQPVGRLDGPWALTKATADFFNAAALPLGSVSEVRINEWFAASADSQPKESFLEIYNPSANPVDLGGLWLSDEPSEVGRRKWQIPAFSFIAGKGYAMFTSGGGTSEPTRFRFEIARGGEYLRLSQNDGTTSQIDAVQFGYLTKAMGRLPDGAESISLLSPTPGTANRADGQGGQVTFAQWSATHGVTDLSADDDGDGFRNVLEFLANSNPKSAATNADRTLMRMSAALEKGSLTLEIGLDRKVSYKELTGEVSSTLQVPWTVLAPQGVEYLEEGRARLKFALPAGDRQFVRLRIVP